MSQTGFAKTLVAMKTARRQELTEGRLENWPWFSTRMATGRPIKSTCGGLMGGKLNGVFSIEWGTWEGLGNKWIFSGR